MTTLQALTLAVAALGPTSALLIAKFNNRWGDRRQKRVDAVAADTQKRSDAAAVDVAIIEDGRRQREEWQRRVESSETRIGILLDLVEKVRADNADLKAQLITLEKIKDREISDLKTELRQVKHELGVERRLRHRLEDEVKGLRGEGSAAADK